MDVILTLKSSCPTPTYNIQNLTLKKHTDWKDSLEEAKDAYKKGCLHELYDLFNLPILERISDKLRRISPERIVSFEINGNVMTLKEFEQEYPEYFI
jgi:hypothetical protein